MKKPRARNLLSAFCLLASLFTVGFCRITGLVADIPIRKNRTTCVNSPIIGIIGEAVMLPCPCMSPINPDQLYLYWQIQQTVVDAFINGEASSSHQDIMYRNRTKLFVRENSSCSLLLSQLSVKDEKTYECLHGSLDIKKNYVSLLVAANYTSLVLQVPSEQPRGRYTCIATGGFPEATIHWLLDNQPLPWDPEPQQSVLDESTGRYNVTSTLAANISQDSTLTCIVENKRLHVNLSQTLNHGLDSPRTRDTPQNHIVIPLAVVSCGGVIVVVCLGIAMMRKYLGTSRRTIQHNNNVV